LIATVVERTCDVWMWVDASSEELLAWRHGIFSKAVIETTLSISKSGTPVCLAHRVKLNLLQIATQGKLEVENTLPESERESWARSSLFE
jgi:hypothetical protein